MEELTPQEASQIREALLSWNVMCEASLKKDDMLTTEERESLRENIEFCDGIIEKTYPPKPELKTNATIRFEYPDDPPYVEEYEDRLEALQHFVAQLQVPGLEERIWKASMVAEDRKMFLTMLEDE